MEHATDYKRRIDAAEPSSAPQETSERTVTQLTPDDLFSPCGIRSTDADGSPSQRQIEQDTITVNPSLDSMDSRG